MSRGQRNNLPTKEEHEDEVLIIADFQCISRVLSIRLKEGPR